MTTEENAELLRLAASHKKLHPRWKLAPCWKEVHANFGAKGDFTQKQLKSRWEVLTQALSSTAKARQCKESCYGQGWGAPRY